MEALDFLRQKEISTVESLDAYLDEASAQAVSIREEIRPMEKRVKEIDRLLFHIGNFEANKPVHAKYAAIRWKKPKEKFAADHKEELDAYNAALRYFKVHLDGAKYSTKKLAGEQAQLSENIASKTEALTAVQEDVKILRDVRHWLNQVLPSEQYRQTAEPGKKPSIQQAVKGREQRIREEQAEKRQHAPPPAKTGYGTLTNQALAIFPVRMTGAFLIFRRICLLNVFEAVKQSVTTRQAAEHYGIRVGRNGMCACPFHDDKNPSMKVDRRFHCFGCQADGDVIDFVSRLENVSPKEAALMLAQDFSIPYEDKEPPSRSRPKRNPRKESPEQQFKRMERHCFRVLSDYHNLLRRWKRDYAPKTPEEEWHPLFVEALQKQSHVEYLLDVLLFSDIGERAALIASYGKEVRNLERRMADLAARTAAGRDGHHRSRTPAPER